MGKDNEQQKCSEGKVLKDGKCLMPEVTFAALVISLNTSALFHLGEIADPVAKEKKKDLVMAQHTIDTLAMLEQKTRGNVTDEEKELLRNVLFDLKMRYVKAVK